MENVENMENGAGGNGHGEQGEHGEVGAGRLREALSTFYTFSTAKKQGGCFDVEIGRAWRRGDG